MLASVDVLGRLIKSVSRKSMKHASLDVSLVLGLLSTTERYQSGTSIGYCVYGNGNLAVGKINVSRVEHVCGCQGENSVCVVRSKYKASVKHIKVQSIFLAQ